MAGRSSKTVEYFPHMLKESTTIKALEMLYGNNGYAVWFKLLEILGVSPDFQYVAQTKEQCFKLLDKFKIDATQMSKILSTLCDLNAIDKDKWKKERILFVPNLVHNIEKMKKKVNTNTNLVESEKKQYAEYVFLLEKEYLKLVDKFGKELTDDKIETLNNWIGENPSEKKRQKDSHYYTILNWDRMELKKNNQKNVQQPKKQQYKDLSNYDYK